MERWQARRRGRSRANGRGGSEWGGPLPGELGGAGRPLFVVGPSRSGTELMRQVLNLHPWIHLAPETYYFEDLRPRLPPARRTRPSATDLDQARAFFASIHGSAYGLGGAEAAAWDRAEGAQRALAGAGDLDAAFEAHRRAMAWREAGKRHLATWGDKTPRHVFCGDEILAAWPETRLLCMRRDPRAAVASYRDWTNRWFEGREVAPGLARAIAAEERRVRRSYALPLTTLLWRAAAQAALDLEHRHGSARVMLVRFEDLLADPVATLGRLSSFLGLRLESDLSALGRVNSSYCASGGERGLDPEALTG